MPRSKPIVPKKAMAMANKTIKCKDCKEHFKDIIGHRKKNHPNLMLQCEFCVDETNSCYPSELALKFHHR